MGSGLQVENAERLRAKTVGLSSVFWRYLTVCGALCVLIAAAWVVALQTALCAGFVLPANAAEEASRAIVERILDGAPFDAQGVPHYVRWARFSPDGRIMESAGMNASGLKAAREQLAGGSAPRGFPYASYHRAVRLNDGSALVLQYDFAVPYADARLDALLPDFQLSMLGALLALWAAALALTTRRFARMLRVDAQALSDAARAVAERRLDAPCAGRARVRELSGALEAIEALRASLADALKAQWAAEARVREEMTALAHDLRTPLTAIIGHADLIEESESGEGARRSARAILREAERLRAYALELDALARGGETEEAREEDVAALFEDWRAAGEALCAAKGLRLTAACRADGRVRVRRETLSRAVINLLDNAARFAQESGEVRLTLFREGGRLCVSVEDDGPGFTNEALCRAGYALYSGEASRTQDGHRGLGLCMARRAAELHGGSLTLKNPDGGGAQATLSLKA